MAKTILTTFQQKLLDILANDPYITRRFYFTGGTVLSQFYLHHRLSEDFDLFSEKEVYLSSVAAFLTKIAPELGIDTMEHRPFLGLHSFILRLKNNTQFKIDFNYYPFPRIEKSKKYKKLDIDSLYDIAVNKVHTLFMNPRTRDYVDLYFIFQEDDMNLDRLISDAKAKFDWHIDLLLLGAKLKKVTQIKDLPRMLVPFDIKKMEKFFLNEAKKLKKEILK
ncbi:TPA: hypothetical protein DD690_04055 [Candidatus Daviesbacteria bacterium]|uniref:Nucleotidyl transferase AbiEii/AbiGii toxin family protein n=1 Tax=Candidatus Daviesbacteria bacterium GW2011_GWF2_38_6 TaxID=1618432 RepID=A0A0G0KSK1_9BACT|nr:MAG: hypothetical protein US99_C0018G0003 [Candidatus Daviesbacteria bacterium GW2011_GWF2_38_6]OGE26442.1 MAG: hypothetical protein A3D02_02730 [Candidatus Daviesbacteria bacterium RIFCSPHIGHO2_02_FULL_39_41]OGE27012.1 MAG: hypothetical protein A2772_00595 [Candidatus Daviesbacteria bacterium RIFCSPHIGHO2_01_FULL_38_8b]OGE43831.1 MAG: hypothetical protein A3E67_04910 [Candidatus Daviesbacteria bacterium RIFCSPHIGHO2_12_FULL_38_25]OGE67418.1 MAG: hypothetical protein A3H81_01240 [Candidatus 